MASTEGCASLNTPGVAFVAGAPSMRISSVKLCRPFWLVTGQPPSLVLTTDPGTILMNPIGLRMLLLKSSGRLLISLLLIEVASSGL